MNLTKSIIFVTISMTGGGTERVISILANHWAAHGVNVTIIMIAGDEVAYALDNTINVRCVSEATGGDNIGRYIRIKKMRDAFISNPQATIIAMGSVASMFSSVALFGLKNKLIVSERNDPNRLNYRPIKPYERLLRNLLYLRASYVVFQTDMAMEAFSLMVRKKGCIIMNPVDDSLPEPSEYTMRKKIIVSAGRINKKKNLRLLIDAFNDFIIDHREYKLLIYGEGEEKDNIEKYIQDMGLDKYVSLEGFSDNICDELNQAQIFVSSSDSEGISNSIVEALAMGLAVIATDCPVGGSRMLIDSGKNGILIGVGNKQELVAALNSAVDLNLSKKLSDEAIKVRKKYSVSSIISEWERLL